MKSVAVSGQRNSQCTMNFDGERKKVRFIIVSKPIYIFF